MRELAGDGQLENRGAPRSSGGSDIVADCDRRLLEVEKNLSSSSCTFEAVQWALGELQRLELYEPNSAPRGLPSSGEGAAFQVAREMSGTSTGNGEKERSALQSKTIDDAGMKDVQEVVRTRPNAQAGVEDSLSFEGMKQDDEDNERHQDGSSGKRKFSDDSSTVSGDAKRARVMDGSAAEVRDMLMTADRGESGKRMTERINSKLGVPERIRLTNLVSRCLLVSVDQAPVGHVDHDVRFNSFSLIPPQDSGKGRVSADGAEERKFGSKVAVGNARMYSTGEWMWLLRWLVRTIMSDVGADGPFASLDWLVASLTTKHSSLIMLVLDDLANDLLQRESEGSATLSSYMRRVGVLEYAAQRDPEQTFENIRPLLPPARFPDLGRLRDDQRHGDSGLEIWQGWLGLMALCPKLFAVVSSFYVPILSVDMIKSWRVQPSTTKSLPAIWTTLLDSYNEEPGTMKEWFYLAILRRVPDLASVATNFVLLLNALSETSADRIANNVAINVANTLLTLLYKTLSTEMLPKVLGGAHDLHADAVHDHKQNGDVNDVSSFLENLKQQYNLIWDKALERFSVATCTCCEFHRSDEPFSGSSFKREEHASNDDSTSVSFETTGEFLTTKGNDQNTLEVHRGCLFRDPLIRLCQLTLLCCTESVVADLLVNSSKLSYTATGLFDSPSLRQLVMVMRVMWITSGQGQERLQDVLELWALQMTDRAAVGNTDQALHIVLAMRELLDSNFWQSHENLLGYSKHSAATVSTTSKRESGRQPGLSWKIVRRELCRALEKRWLNILPSMHRDDAWDLKLAVLGVLQLLNPDATTRPQVVADRLKGALGLLFSWLEMCDSSDSSNLIARQSGTSRVLHKPRWRWHYACANEHLKSIIIELSSSSLPSFTLMVNSLLDFSFDYSTQTFTKAVRSSESGRSVVVAPLSTGKLDRYGKLVLTSALASELSAHESPQAFDMRLQEENQRIQSGGSISRPQKQEKRISSVYVDGTRHPDSPASTLTPENIRQHLLLRSKITNAELGSLLRRTLDRAVARSVELLDAWPCHPVNVLATHLADRLETPHEVPMKMEQYEEVLPKYISSPRHIFLADCFSQYPLLMEMVELVVKHGNRALRCVEFVRVLLADSISSWHGTFRPRWPHCLLQPKGEAGEVWNRMQASRLIQLVASAHWLPPPLAASAEIVGAIDGTDISDLLLLVWRCMHHSIAFGPRAWGESSSNLHAMENQGLSSPGSGPDEDGSKEGTFTEWEGHFFAILRRNVSKIGAHFAQVYPVRKAL